MYLYRLEVLPPPDSPNICICTTNQAFYSNNTFQSSTIILSTPSPVTKMSSRPSSGVSQNPSATPQTKIHRTYTEALMPTINKLMLKDLSKKKSESSKSLQDAKDDSDYLAKSRYVMRAISSTTLKVDQNRELTLRNRYAFGNFQSF